MEEKDKKNILVDGFVALANIDSTLIIVCVIAVGICLYTLVSVDGYQKAINDKWMEQWDKSGCKSGYEQPNISWNWRNEYDTENNSTYPKGSGTR